MVEYMVTTCSKEKDPADGVLPAIQRYQHPRIDWVYQESQRLDLPMLILSGKYGLIRPDDPIPWYDQALTLDNVSTLLPILTEQLHQTLPDLIHFIALPPETPGWAPYHLVLEQACAPLKVKIRLIPWLGE